MFADDFLPVYDVSDEVATVVDADSQTVWEALMDVDLLEVGKRVPLAGVLGALRMLPEIVSHLLHGERPPRAPESMRLRELAEMPAEQGGWIFLGERPGGDRTRTRRQVLAAGDPVRAGQRVPLLRFR